MLKDGILYSDVSLEEVDHALPSEKIHFFEHFFGLIKQRLENEPTHPFLINAMAEMGVRGDAPLYGSDRLLIHDLEGKARAAAAHLRSIGFSQGDTLHIAIPTNVEFFVPVIGALLNNGIVSAGDPCLNVSHISGQLSSLKAKVIICCEENLATFKKALEQSQLDANNVHLYVMVQRGRVNAHQDLANNTHCFEALLNNEMVRVVSVPPAHLESPCFITWSSGTTGAPKGIIQSWRTLWRAFDSWATFACTKMHDIVLTTTCQFHIAGFIVPIATVRKNRTLVLMDSDALGEHTVDLFMAMDKYQPGTLFMGSHHCNRIAFFPDHLVDTKWNLNSVTQVIPAGSSVPRNMLEHLNAKLPNVPALEMTYGTTELCVLVTWSQTQGCLGPVTSGCVARIEDFDTRQILGANQRGELVVKSSRRMLGYLDMSEATKESMLDDGFIRTGDCCYYDQQGNLYFESRIKDIIKVENYHIQPKEIEHELEVHPEVLEAAVFGRPDPFFQELVTALVIPKAGALITETELRIWVDQRLEKHQIVRGGITFVSQLPRGRTGKLLRRSLSAFWQQTNNEED